LPIMSPAPTSKVSGSSTSRLDSSSCARRARRVSRAAAGQLRRARHRGSPPWRRPAPGALCSLVR
jgi:hypothetical protein